MKNKWMRTTVAALSPYVVAPIAETRVVNANENYLNVLALPGVREELISALENFMPAKYSDPMAETLRKDLAAYIGCRSENILCGNGGDEMITTVLGTFLNPGDTLLTHTPTFDMYAIGADILGARVFSIPDVPGYRRNTDALLAAVSKLQPKLTVICNPNNPTGELLPKSFIEEILKIAGGLVFVDEAYMEFAKEEESVKGLIGKYPNLIVLRTLSKAFAMAGCRLGYVVADAEIISALTKIKPPYNVNSFTQLLAPIVLRHREEIFKIRDAICDERDKLFDALSEIPALSVYPSRTNFLLVQTGKNHEAIFEALRRENILVKIYRNRPDLPNAYRITVTDPDTNSLILKVFREALS